VIIVGVAKYAFRSKTLTDEQLQQELTTIERLVEAHDHRAAAARLAKLHVSADCSARLLLRMAQLAIDADATEQANPILDRLELVDSFKAKAIYLRGIAAIKRNQAVQAELYWKHSVQINPSLISGWERLSQLYLTQIRSGDLRHALGGLQLQRRLSLDELVAYTSAYEPYYSAEERLNVVDAYASADHNDVFSLVAAARYQMMNDRIDQALERLNVRNPQAMDPKAVSVAVDGYLKQGDQASARRLLSHWPVSANIPIEISRARGILDSSTGQSDSAAWHLVRTVLDQPEDTAALYRLGISLERLGHHDPSKTALQLAATNERIGLLVYRIRRTSELPPAKLAPLYLELAQALQQSHRNLEASWWLQLAIPHLAPENYRPLSEALTKDRSNKTPIELQLIAAINLPAPTAEQVEIATQSSSTTSLKTATPSFTDVHESAGIEFQYESGSIGQKWLLESLGGGVTVLDYNGDGWPDLYFCQGGPLQAANDPPPPNRIARVPDKLFRNLGNGHFSDVTVESGLGDFNYSQGSTAADFDNDGDPDLVVANFGNNVFYRNNGDGTFSDISNILGLNQHHWHTSLGFSDLDRDGDLDLFIATYVGEPFKICRRSDGRFTSCSPANYPADEDFLYLNQGDGTFLDVSKEAGIHAPGGKGLGVVIAELTGDRLPDIYVTNDGTPNFLFRNDGLAPNGLIHFTEIGMAAGCAVNEAGIAQAGMGIASDDFDHNGWLDLYTTNFFKECNTLFFNLGDGVFEDRTAFAGLLKPTRQMLGFGVQSIDFASTGNSGVFIANGHIDDFGDRNEPWKMPPQLFSGDGQGRFQETSATAGPYFQQQMLGRAVARLDFDRDLRPDLVVTHLNRPAALLHNDTQDPGNVVVLSLVGTVSNRDGIGCRVQTTLNGKNRIFEVTSGDGYFACNERCVTIGLGQQTRIESLQIHWPLGAVSTLNDISANSRLRVIEGTDVALPH